VNIEWGGAVPLRTYSTFRPGSSNIACATASSGVSRDYLNPISVAIATPLILYCKNTDLHFVMCSVMTQKGAKNCIRISDTGLYISVLRRTVVPIFSLVWCSSSAGVLCWLMNVLLLYWLFLYVSSSLYPMCIMVFTPFVVGIVRQWISRTNKVR
jgi:hypothetical protein